MMPDDTLSTIEAAKLLGVPRQKINYAIKKGRIKFVQRERTQLDERSPAYRIPRQEIERLLNQAS